MALSVDYSGATYRITVPQSDLTLISGNLYELDTGWFWEQVKLWEASETGIVFEDMQSHNPEYQVAGETFARKIEVLNASNSTNTHVYEVFFSPDNQYSVKLTGSNNNIFDLQNSILANTTTQVIPTNSAGLIASAAMSTTQDQNLTEIHRAHFNRRKHDTTANTITIYDSDNITPLHVFDAEDDLTDITPQ